MLVATSIAAGCSDDGPDAVEEVSRPKLGVRERTLTRFGTAAQLMPGNLQEDHLPSSLAPLILVKDNVVGQWGAVGSDGGLERVDTPVVYYGTTRALVTGRYRDQYHYHWWHRADEDDQWRSQGVRITVDEAGLPRVWEVQNDASKLRLLYVSERLEQQARRRHGDPVRVHAIERSAEDLPDVVVARTLTDGPVPMGPWVYVESGAGDVITLVCRCMPSQASGPLERTDYQLVPWSSLSSLPDPWPEERADAAPQDRLDGWLRWP